MKKLKWSFFKISNESFSSFRILFLKKYDAVRIKTKIIRLAYNFQIDSKIYLESFFVI